MKFLLVTAFTLWACFCYAQSANSFAHIPARTENSYPFSSTQKFQGAPPIDKGLGMFSTFKEDIIAMLLDHVSEKSLKRNLSFLGGDKCDMTSTNGDSLAADFISRWIKKYKLSQELPGPKRQLVNNADNVAIVEGYDKKAGYIIFIARRNHPMQAFDSSSAFSNNTCGTVALMECAKAFAAFYKEGIYPKRSIIFIATTEEHQLLNADYLRSYSNATVAKIKSELNIDMLSRIEGKHVDSITTNNKYVYSIFYDSTHLLKPVPEKVSLENNFIVQPNYTLDKMNYKLLTQKTKLALNVLWKLAND